MEAIGGAIAAIAGWTGFACIVGIAAFTFLFYTDKITIEDIKSLRERRR